MRRLINSLKNTLLIDTTQDNFWHYYSIASRKFIRYGMILSFCLYGIFGVLDVYMAPYSRGGMGILRFAIVMPLCLIAIGVTYSKFFPKYAQMLTFLFSLMVSSGVIFIIWLAREGELAYKFYYSGLLLTIIGTHSIFRVRSQLALITTVLTIFNYNFVMIFFELDMGRSEDLVILINNNFFLFSAGIIGVLATHATEKMFKKNYEDGKIIIAEKEHLKSAQKKLVEQDVLKSKLISIVSHDLKAPINSVKGFMHLFNIGHLTMEELKTHSMKLTEALEGVSGMLNNILSWSVMQLTNTWLKPQVFDVCELIEEVFSQLKLQALEKNNELINLANDSFKICGDANVIQLVLRNLVSNAIKFTENGKIEVRASIMGSSIQISVTDNGRGIPEDLAGNLFNWKIKTSTQGTRSEKGSGIGLLICKDFIEKLGGLIYYNSKWRHGTTFTFVLPVFAVEENNIQELKEVAIN